ncbi:MAG: SIR2 family protein [Promethearchaeota archaeon]
METIDKIPKKMGEILPALFENGFIAYCGAGISISSPTCAPSWWTLAEEILFNFFENVPDDWGVPKKLIIKDPNFQPEALLETWANIHGVNLYKVFQVLDVNVPNANHQLLAKLAKTGLLKAVFTTNFDRYVERAFQSEGVEFELLVDNNEYDEFFKQVKTEGLGNKVLICKIHGTIERPNTIVAVASAYKSAGGFSLVKAELFLWLIKKYPCLFLGYSGWDFEHVNYRTFWEKVGPELKNIFWNIRPGETGGPDFNSIFSTSRTKFNFVEADLPEGWFNALKQNPPSNLNLENLTLPDPNKAFEFEEETKLSRDKFLDEWAINLPEWDRLTTVIVEGYKHSEKFKETTKKSQDASTSVDYDKEKDDITLKERENLTKLYQEQRISREEYDEQIDKLDMQRAFRSLPNDCKPTLTKYIEENRFPGITDDRAKRQQFLAYVTTLAYRFDPEDAIKHAVDISNKDTEIQQMYSTHTTPETQRIPYAETMMNNFKLSVLRPDEEDWKPAWDELSEVKDKYIRGEISQADFTKFYTDLSAKATFASMGMTVPVDDLFNREIELVANATNKEDFKKGCSSLFWAMTYGMSSIKQKIYETKEHNALLTALNPSMSAMPDPAETQKKTEEFQKISQELMKKMMAGEISNEDYTSQITELSQKLYAPQPQAAQQMEDGHVIVPENILNDYVKIFREMFEPVFKRHNNLFGNEITESYMLIEMGLLSLLLMRLQSLEISSGEEYQERQRKGQYGLMRGNPSIYRYLRKMIDPWLQKALNEIPERYGQRFCYNLIKLAEMGYDLELCKQATEVSLAYTNGKMTEATPQEGPSSIATFYEDAGYKENALKYYNIALEGMKLAYPPYWQYELIYRTALILNEQGKKEEALKIIGTYHSEYHGHEPPYKTMSKAKKLCIELANQLSSELGYSDTDNAIDSLLK